ncbi:hypothetical protein [Altericista sp. CCNU0014]|uniref:hypothetical protein n=1 Tax=Altericista sp. CCNU0014 TaxID=3082949 RepID=UPI00384BE7A4
MVIAVISFNIALAALCLGIAWKLRQAKRSLRRATRWLVNAERNTSRVLSRAPYHILLGQSGVQYGRGQIAGLGALQQQIARFAALLKLLQWMGRRPLQPIPRRLAPRAKLLG